MHLTNIYSIHTVCQSGSETEFKLLKDVWQEKGPKQSPEGLEQELTSYRLKDHPNQAGEWALLIASI